MGPGRYLIFFLIKFPVKWRQNHVWGPIFSRVMTIFINVTILEIICYVYMREGKKGREKGKDKKGREKGKENGKGKRERKKGREKGKGKREGKKGREKGKGKREGKKGLW